MEQLEARRLLSADFNDDSRADLVWHNKSTGEVSISEIDDDHGGSSHALGTVPPEWDVAGYGDFNRDGSDDILWRNSLTGENVVWVMDSEAIRAALVLPDVGPNSGWEIGGVGDFNNDSRPDVLWRNFGTGENVVWIMQDQDSVDHSESIESVAGKSWHVGGVADFDDNGRVDIVWRNDDTGENAIWLMTGTTRSGSVDLPVVQGSEWSIGSVGNLTGGSDDDILWRRSTDGACIAWRMNKTSVVTSDMLTPAVNGDWTVGGGDNRTQGDDWDRDGNDDILWLDSQNGRGLVWYLDDSSVSGTNSVSDLGQQVRGLQAVEDFDGQRGIDFLIRDPDSGEVSIQLRLAGTSNFSESERGVIDTIVLGTVADMNWVISGVGDFDGDESPDILWRNTATSATIVWLLNNGRYSGALVLPAVPVDTWRVEAVHTNDADDTVDMYWRNLTTGENVVWTVAGDTITSVRALYTVDDQSWHMQDAFDLGDDGVADVVWVNDATSQVRVWFYDAQGYSGTSVLGELPTADSSIVA